MAGFLARWWRRREADEMSEDRCDLLLRGGTVIDGTGSPRRTADLAVAGDRIAAVGRLDAMKGERELDAGGLVVAPGFIDTHTHDDRAVLSDPAMACKASQGVATVVTGNCGVSLAPLTGGEPPPPLNLLGDASWYRFPDFAAYREELEGAPAGPQRGHAGRPYRAARHGHGPARPARLGARNRAHGRARRRGHARGVRRVQHRARLSPRRGRRRPGRVVAIARRVAAHGGMHSTHMRDEEAGVLDSVRETLRIGRDAGLPVVISHHKCAGRENWGRSRETLALIAEAQAAQAIDLDVYPYVAGSTVLLEAFVAPLGKGDRDLVGAAPGAGRSRPRRHRPRLALRGHGSGRAAPARRRHLLPDA